ncbi:MAG: nucleotidyltransferase domain-containing protein [Thermoanaerobaculia bacterium]|nr:nucleotidyltransferase domain-containing protein [Thermoanaerobaculia bacterium]
MRTTKADPLDSQPAAVTRALRRFAEATRERLGDRVEHLVFFGSRARGNARPDSDIDVLVVVADLDWDTENEVLNLAADVGLEHDVALSPVVLKAETFETWRRQERPLVMDAARQGVPL